MPKPSPLVPFLLAMTLVAHAPASPAGQCEDNFTTSGNAFRGKDFASTVRVPDLAPAAALGQLRGIMIAEGMDVIAEDPDGGTMLVEQRSTGATRAIPTLINVEDDGGAAKIAMTVKTESGQLARTDAMQAYLCELLAQVQGGEAGRAAAARGALASNSEDITRKDVYVFSREIAREAKGNALAVGARHRGRNYALSGRVDYIQEDGEHYNVSFDIPDVARAQLRLPGDDEPRVGVACLFGADQLANVLTFREGDAVTFTGSFLRYDDGQRMVWLQNCRQARR
jgi:hypothetical protein